MNHYADIDEGLDVFDEEQERRESEHQLRNKPDLIRIGLSPEGYTERTFRALRVNVLHLTGDRRAGAHPTDGVLDFSDGYIEAEGFITVDGLVLPGCILEFRWSGHGDTRDEKVRFFDGA